MRHTFKLPLVNAHTHAAMVAFRGMAEDLPLDRWLNDHIWPAESRHVSADFVYRETKKAILEMKKNGIAVFSDMYFFEEQVAEAAIELGIHAVIGEGVIDFPTPSAKTPAESLAATEKLLKKYKNNSLIKVAVSPHSIYTVSKKNLLKAKKLADKYQAIFHIHLAETKSEFDECLAKNKLTPVAYLDKLGILNERAILAHCVWLTSKDLKIMAKRKVNVAHCPLSNLKLGSGIAPVKAMLDHGINVCLGTDGAASSNRLDIWEAGKFAVLLQKGITNDPTVIPVKKAIEMMTVNGLRALGLTEINGQKISAIQKEINDIDKFDFLYSHHIHEIL